MLVLLIIFMVAAPLLTVGVPIALPKTAAAPLPTEKEEPLTIALTADGKILVQNNPVEREKLIPLLRAVSEQRKSSKIFLRADGSIPYEGVMQVMGALNASGFNDIGLVTEQGGPKFDGADG
jgi:biopolymer transport protein TolR